jgi:hypothetical protein
MRHVPFFLSLLIPAVALAQTTEERLSQLEARVKALEEAQKIEPPSPSPAVAKDAPIQLVDWDFVFERGNYNQNQYKITYALKNTSDKAIKLNESAINFVDLLGENIASFRINADLKLPAGKVITNTEYYAINQFIPSQLRLKGMEKVNIKALLVVAKAVFADGSIYADQTVR